jgi:hypothetical protein
MDGPNEEEDLLEKLGPDELKVMQRVLSDSLKVSEVFFGDDSKKRKDVLKALNKVVVEVIVD